MEKSINIIFEKYKKLLLKEKLDGILLFDLSSRRHITHFNSSDGVVLVTPEDVYFIIDFRYYEAASGSQNYKCVKMNGGYIKTLRELVNSLKLCNIGINPANVTLHKFELLKKQMPSAFFVQCAGIASVRYEKTPFEIENIKKAQGIAERAFLSLLKQIKIGVAEKDLADELEYSMKKLGAEGCSFDTILISGTKTSLPHGAPDNSLVTRGALTIDFGAKYNGLCSDTTRTVFVGEATKEQQKVYNTVLDAQSEALKAIKAGAKCNAIDKIARDIIDAEYPGAFGHSLGHSLGYDIHEPPNLSYADSTVLMPGNVVSVEPGIYIGGRFGVRIEDIVCVTDTGYQNLTALDKSITVI